MFSLTLGKGQSSHSTEQSSSKESGFTKLEKSSNVSRGCSLFQQAQWGMLTNHSVPVGSGPKETCLSIVICWSAMATNRLTWITKRMPPRLPSGISTCQCQIGKRRRVKHLKQENHIMMLKDGFSLSDLWRPASQHILESSLWIHLWWKNLTHCLSEGSYRLLTELARGKTEERKKR